MLWSATVTLLFEKNNALCHTGVTYKKNALRFFNVTFINKIKTNALGHIEAVFQSNFAHLCIYANFLLNLAVFSRMPHSRSMKLGLGSCRLASGGIYTLERSL